MKLILIHALGKQENCFAEASIHIEPLKTNFVKSIFIKYRTLSVPIKKLLAFRYLQLSVPEKSKHQMLILFIIVYTKKIRRCY